MQEEKSREHLILKTLSFYEPMNYAQIIFELDSEELKQFPNFTDEELKNVLKDLVRRKLVKKISKNGDVYWQRQMPIRAKSRVVDFFRRIFGFLSK